ncbi:MAG: hypothetical protein IT280_02280 [Ignavibacteria bacterium]|nr:hypothetical protein [Ignavibacteria bacterium]
MKQKRDVKFIIYQSLYIFIICIIAMKGADINLDAVEIKRMIDPGYVYIDTSGKILIERDKASKLIEFDSTRYIVISRDEYNKNPDKFAGLVIDNPGSIGSVIAPIQSPNDNTSKIPDDTKNIDPGSQPIQVKFPSNFVQFRQNIIQNPNSAEMKVIISSGTTVIPGNSSKSITIMGDNTITLSAGGNTETFNVKENKKPQVIFHRITIMNDEARVTTLQRNVFFRLTVQDDYSDQLEVKINGPVKFKQVSDNTFDITMNAFGSISSYENYIENKNSPYSVGFTVLITDKISGHKITGQQRFVFGNW